MGVQMLVSDYLDQVIKSRPYKYSTKQSLIRDVKRLGIADLDTSEITSALIRDKVDCIPNHNSRRRLFVTTKFIFKDLVVRQDLPKIEGMSHIYDFPEMEDSQELIDQCKFRNQFTYWAINNLKLTFEHPFLVNGSKCELSLDSTHNGRISFSVHADIPPTIGEYSAN